MRSKFFGFDSRSDNSLRLSCKPILGVVKSILVSTQHVLVAIVSTSDCKDILVKLRAY